MTEVSYGSPVLDVCGAMTSWPNASSLLTNADGYVFELDEDATSLTGPASTGCSASPMPISGRRRCRKRGEGGVRALGTGPLDARMAWSLDYRPSITSEKQDVHIDASGRDLELLQLE